MKCLGPNCDKDSVCRGLCLICYKSASRLICKGFFTWEQLEELRLSEPKAPPKEKQSKEIKKKKPVGRPGKFTEEEFRATCLEYDAAYQGNKKTTEFYKGFLEANSNRLTEWQKEDIEKMLRPFIMEEEDRVWREKRASQNTPSDV
jgi:hypothetical protein